MLAGARVRSRADACGRLGRGLMPAGARCCGLMLAGARCCGRCWARSRAELGDRGRSPRRVGRSRPSPSPCRAVAAGEFTLRNDTRYFGAIVGRVANRIAGAKFTLNGTVYKLNANEGTNMLHGGKKGFSQVAWKLKGYRKCGGPRRSPYITFTYHSVDGEEGFPGDVLVSVTYVILDPYGFTVNMKAEALNKPTPISLAQHTYWNLGGHDSGDILSDQLKIFGSRMTPVGEKLIPTGEIVPVKSTPYDFLEVREINGQMKQLPEGSRGYDINYVVDNVYGMKDNYAAYLYNEKSGREMRLWAGAPGLQLYTANYINGVKGKGGFVYQPHAALCLESQGFPDAVNHPNFPSQIVYPGQKYEHSMLFSFSIRKW
ncbi:hypothetical protein OROMI_032546 [Orobanche minor]